MTLNSQKMRMPPTKKKVEGWIPTILGNFPVSVKENQGRASLLCARLRIQENLLQTPPLTQAGEQAGAEVEVGEGVQPKTI